MIGRAVIEEEIVGHSDRATFLELFDFTIVAFADGLSIKRAVGTLRDTFIAELFWGNDGDEDEAARELVEEGSVFSPRVESVEDDVFLAGGDKVFGLGDRLFRDPILAFGLANHFAESFFAFAIDRSLDATFFHFTVNHVPEVNFGKAFGGEVVDDDGFTAAAHADDSEDFYIVFCHVNNYSMIKSERMACKV